jgi:hypothetical protein
MSHPLDAPYNKDALEFIRAHIHKNIAKKMCFWSRTDYILLFLEEEKPTFDIKYNAGNPVQILLGTSPYNGSRVEHLARRAFSLPDRLFKQFLRSLSIIKRSDAVAWYGLEVVGPPCPEDLIKEEFKFYKKKIQQEVWITVTVTDPDTGRSMSVRQKNGNAFDMEIAAVKLLRGGL